MVLFKKIPTFLAKHKDYSSQNCCSTLGLYKNQWGPIFLFIPKQLNLADIDYGPFCKIVTKTWAVRIIWSAMIKKIIIINRLTNVFIKHHWQRASSLTSMTTLRPTLVLKKKANKFLMLLVL